MNRALLQVIARRGITLFYVIIDMHFNQFFSLIFHGAKFLSAVYDQEMLDYDFLYGF